MNIQFPDRVNNWSSVEISIYTNWEAGFKKGYDTLRDADLVIFVTDGNPNARLDDSGNAVIIVNSANPTQAQAQISIDETVPITNLWKSQGTKIVAVGVAEVTPSIPNNFEELTDGSNTTLFTGSNFGTADYLSIATFAEFGNKMNLLADGFCATAPTPGVTVSGTVFDDADGSKLLNGTETGTNGGGLNAVLVDSTNKVVATTAVAANGTYTFSDVPTNANYTVQITTATATVGSAPPAVTLPSNWVSTGENLNSAIDGTVDSKLSVAVTTSNITGANFGIEQVPNTTDLNATSQTNPGGTNQVQVPTLAGTDPEDGALGIGKSFKIVTLPTNGTLYYNGSAVTAGQVINNYDPTKLKLDPNDGAITASFTYAAIDAAGKEDPTPATVSVPFTAPVVTNAKVLLVKRITAINSNSSQNPNDGTVLNVFVEDSGTTDDNNANWPERNTYLRGAINGGLIKPNDEIEYTVYFLNTQNNAQTVTACDLVPDHQTFVATGYNNVVPHPTEPGAILSDTGIGLALNSTTLPTLPTAYLTNLNDSDRGRYYPSNASDTPSTCQKFDNLGNVISSGSAANTNGAVVIEIIRGAEQLPPATAPGTPPNSYGFIRFKTQVN
jgi:hypothetical protein